MSVRTDINKQIYNSHQGSTLHPLEGSHYLNKEKRILNELEKIKLEISNK